MSRVLLTMVVAGILGGNTVFWWPIPASESQISPVPRVDEPPDSLVAPIAVEQADFGHDFSANFHAHGEQVCASGCALSRHPTERLTKQRYLQLLGECSSSAFDGDNLAFETLLYFGRQTTNLSAAYGTPHLDEAQSGRLQAEIQKQHAIVSIRVVDEQNKRRSWINEVRVPLDRRHVFDMKTDDLQPLVTSGTVKRVGLNHLWTRL